jgi:hypothetical protein
MVAASAATTSLLALAPAAQSRWSQADCGPMGKGEVYIMSGIENLNCTMALAIAER